MKKGSVLACKLGVALCALLLLALLFLAPGLTDWYAKLRGLPQEGFTAIVAGFYACALPSALALACLMKLLQNISKGKLFDLGNTRMISLVAWCCLAVALITGVACIWYHPLGFVAGAMLVLFLVVQVVCGCFRAAITLKEENDLTI